MLSNGNGEAPSSHALSFEVGVDIGGPARIGGSVSAESSEETAGFEVAPSHTFD